MPRQPDFFRRLSGPPQQEELEEFARQPGRIGDEILTWLAERGIKTSRSALFRWLEDFRLEDRTRRAGELARNYIAVKRLDDSGAVTAASLDALEDRVFEMLARGEELSASELRELSAAMGGGLRIRRELIDMRRQQADALKAAESAAKTGASATDVVATIKKSLGIAA